VRLRSCKSLVDISTDYLISLTDLKDNGTPKWFQNQKDFYDHVSYDASLTDLPIIFANLIVSYAEENNCFHWDCIIGMQSNINRLS